MSQHDISMKVYKIRGEIMIAACDRELLDKKFEEDELVLEVKRSFYYDVYVSDQTFLNSIKIATIANLVGKHVISLAIKEGFIDEGSVMEIDGIPHAQMVVMF